MTLNRQVRGEKRASFIALFREERKFAIPFQIASLARVYVAFSFDKPCFFTLLRLLVLKNCILQYRKWERFLTSDRLTIDSLWRGVKLTPRATFSKILTKETPERRRSTSNCTRVGGKKPRWGHWRSGGEVKLTPWTPISIISLRAGGPISAIERQIST